MKDLSVGLVGKHSSTRLKNLDGLRGIAALIVLFHHSLLTIPSLADPYFSGRPAEAGTTAWWMIHTPLHLLWEGKAAVYIFFILSGFVLTLPVLEPERLYSWRAFYPQRLVRLYLPVWGAVAFAVLVFCLLPRAGEPASRWLQAGSVVFTPTGLVKSLTLVDGTGGLVSPLWSLQWEVFFSLAVPLYIWVAIRLSKWPWLVLALSVIVSAVGGAFQQSVLIYAPMFMVGVIFAIRLDQLRSFTVGWKNTRWVLIVMLGGILMSSHWIALAFSPGPRFVGSMIGLTLAGSSIIFLAALTWPWLGNQLSTSVPLWLGTVSFSIYLIHEPIVVSLGYIAGPDLWWSIPLGIFLSLAVGHLFYLVVEKPSHKLAQKLKQQFAHSQSEERISSA